MKSILYLVAVALIFSWALGVFVYRASGLIHVLLVLAALAILFRLMGSTRV